MDYTVPWWMLNLRLRRTIPWSQTSIGAYQEAMVAGQVAARVYWKTDAKKQIDELCIDLIPIENLVISPSARWEIGLREPSLETRREMARVVVNDENPDWTAHQVRQFLDRYFA
jgi:hypothetical protein